MYAAYCLKRERSGSPFDARCFLHRRSCGHCLHHHGDHPAGRSACSVILDRVAPGYSSGVLRIRGAFRGGARGHHLRWRHYGPLCLRSDAAQSGAGRHRAGAWVGAAANVDRTDDPGSDPRRGVALYPEPTRESVRQPQGRRAARGRYRPLRALPYRCRAGRHAVAGRSSWSLPPGSSAARSFQAEGGAPWR